MRYLKDFDYLFWRDSALKAKAGFGPVGCDGIVLIPWLLALFTFNKNIALFSLVLTLGLTVLDFLGYDTMVTIKRIRKLIAGKKRYVRNSKLRRRRLFK